MSTRRKLMVIGIRILVVLLMLAVAESVFAQIPIQGRLTGANGTPLPDGNYDVTFSLYESSTGNDLVCSDTNSVSIKNGIFHSEIEGCSTLDISGQQLYLGIKVESDEEMTPRQPIYPVPYAMSLKPGAIIKGALSTAIVHIENSHSTGRGMRVYAMSETGTNYGIVGASRSPDGYGGYFYNNGGGVGLLGKTDVNTNFGVVGLQTGYSLSDFHSGEYWESGGFFGGRNGVIGKSKEGSGWGVLGDHDINSGTGAGVKGTTRSPDGWSASFTTGAGNGVYVSTPAGKTGLNVVGGTKNAIVGTSDGSRLLYSEESTEVWFTDYGFGILEDGVAIIPIDSMFAQTVNLADAPYHVFVQVYGDTPRST